MRGALCTAHEHASPLVILTKNTKVSFSFKATLSKLIFIPLCKNVMSPFFSGIKHEWQVNGLEDLKDRHTLAEKLGGNSVISLEGAPI